MNFLFEIFFIENKKLSIYSRMNYLKRYHSNSDYIFKKNISKKIFKLIIHDIRLTNSKIYSIYR